MEHVEADQLLVAHFARAQTPRHICIDCGSRCNGSITASAKLQTPPRLPPHVGSRSNRGWRGDPDCMHLRPAAVEMNISGCSMPNERAANEARRLH